MPPAASRTEDARLAEAAAWRVRLTQDDLATSPDFEAWLDDHPANAAAWSAVAAPWDEIGAAAASPELLALRRDALDRARRQASSRWAGPALPRRAVAGGAIAAVAALTAGGAWLMDRPEIYHTGPGERRVVALGDGSRVSLDSASRVQVRFTRQARRLELLSGQARFDVAKDPARPFSVQAGDQTVVATGTSFSIDRLGARVRVTLLEGRVSVIASTAGDRPSAVELRAGEQLTAAAPGRGAPAQVETVALDKAVAWERGQLIFEDEPLSAVAERISRYTARPVVVKDAAAGALRISGVFTAGDLATFVDTVTAYLPVRAKAGPGGETELFSSV